VGIEWANFYPAAGAVKREAAVGANGRGFNAETQRRGEMGGVISHSPHRAEATVLMKTSAFHNHFISIFSLKSIPLPKVPQRMRAFRSTQSLFR
jgi:hypothetical protein